MSDSLVTVAMLVMATLAGSAAEPPLGAARIVSAWRLDPGTVVAVVVLVAGYLRGLRRLKARQWPAGRTVAWMAGVGLLAVTTTGVLGVYDEVLFWPDVTEHVILGLLVPVVLAFGMPVALAARTMQGRARERLYAALRSRVGAVAGNPIVSFTLLMTAFVVPYPTGGYAAALDHPGLHGAWHLSLLVLGVLLAVPLLGLDPVPGRVPHLFRQALMLVSLPVYVVIGLAVLNSEGVYAADHFATLDRGWGPSVGADQDLGGTVFAWAGNALSILLGFVLLILWMREEGVRTRHLDRTHDRLVASGLDDETELARYNAWLDGLRDR